MIRIFNGTGRSILFGALVLGGAEPVEAAHAANFQVLYVFQNGDAASPFGAMVKGNKGRYGATYCGTLVCPSDRLL
jgi:hypothetical protein